MKRIIALAVCLLLVLAFPSCAQKEMEKTGKDTVTSDTEPLFESTAALRDSADALKREDETTERWMPIFEWETDRDAHLVLGDPDPIPETEAETVTEAEEETEAPAPLYYPTVFMYHAVNDVPFTPNEILFVRPSELDAQIKAAVEGGYETLFADEFGPREGKSIILTFDDGYEDNYTNMFPILKKYNAKATVYLITSKLDTPNYLKTWQVKEMAESGLVQFGSHTVYHPYLSKIDIETARREMSLSNEAIEAITGEKVTTVAYPTGDYNEEVLEIARELYDFGYAMNAGRYTGEEGEDPYTIPRFAILRGVTGTEFLKFLY